MQRDQNAHETTNQTFKPSIRYAYGVVPVLLVSVSRLCPSSPPIATVITWGGEIKRLQPEDIKTADETTNTSRIGRFKIPAPYIPGKGDAYWTPDTGMTKAVSFTFCGTAKETQMAMMGYFFRTELEALAYIAGCRFNVQESQQSLKETL